MARPIKSRAATAGGYQREIDQLARLKAAVLNDDTVTPDLALAIARTITTLAEQVRLIEVKR